MPDDAAVLLQAEQLRRQFGHGDEQVTAMDGVSFDIRSGECFGIVGESGSGKSTVARSVLRLQAIDSGTVRFRGEDLASLTRPQLRRRRRSMQIVMQDPYSSLNRRQRVEDLIAMPLRAHGVERRTAEARVGALLSQVGLTEAHRRRYTHELSGGQCQRVAIARALALEPSLLVLDEAVSALDVSVRAQILNLLRELQSSLGLTYLFISHDLAVVRYMCHRIAVMYRGRIVETGTREEIFTRPAHPYTRSLLRAVPRRDGGRSPAPDTSRTTDAAPGSGCGYAGRCTVSPEPDRCAGSVPELLTIGAGAHRAACHFPQGVTARAGTPA